MKKQTQKGITLIALIITIIVMLILVGVTINVALNGGLFEKAEIATKETEEKAILEEMLAMIDITDNGKINSSEIISRMRVKYPTLQYNEATKIATITGKLGTYNYIVSETEIKIGSNEPVDDKLAKYLLGADLQGRNAMDIFDGTTFIDDPNTEEDESKYGVEMFHSEYLEHDRLNVVYVKYDSNIYKIQVDENFMSQATPGLVKVYEPKGNEGKTTADGWTILYDNGATVEAVSPTAMGELRIGYSETTTYEQRLEEAIDSYNNAIKTINTYCKNLEGLPTNTGVRSVGGTTDTSSYFNESDIPEYTIGTDTWFSAYNGNIKAGDISHEQDLIRMIYWGVESSDVAYWIASRFVSYGSVNDYSNSMVSFFVRHGGKRQISGYDFYIVDIKNTSLGSSNSGYYTTTSVRPIITVENI